MSYLVNSYAISQEERANRIVAITFKVLSSPPSKSENRKIFPYRSFYGYATFLNGIWVMGQCQLEFERQIIYFWHGVEHQHQSAIYESQYATATSIKAFEIVINPTVKIGVLAQENPTPRNVIACPIDSFTIAVMPGVVYDVAVMTEPIDSPDFETVQYRMLQL